MNWLLPLVVLGVIFVGGKAVASTQRRRLLNPDAADGLDPRLQAALAAWDNAGTFDVRIADDARLPFGGLRTADDQARAVELGLTNALTLATTPHGRGGAMDLWPEGFNPWRGLTEQPQARSRFLELVGFMEARGLVAGIHFTSIVAPDGTKGDWPHFEVPDWQRLPFPPAPRGVA